VALNIERFKADLEQLIAQGAALETGFLIDIYGKLKLTEQYKKANYSDRDIEVILKSAISFGENYQTWYSEASTLIRQILPDRAADFISHYEGPKNRKEVLWGTYAVKDALLGLKITRGSEVLADAKAALPHFRSQRAILRASKARFQSSLFEIRQLVQADLFDSEIESAKALLKSKFLRAAGAVAGVVLEKHLHQVCSDHGVKIAKKNPSISDYNEALKTTGVIDLPQWRHISMLADIRNLCDHKKDKEPIERQVEDLISGVDKILKTVA